MQGELNKREQQNRLRLTAYTLARGGGPTSSLSLGSSLEESTGSLSVSESDEDSDVPPATSGSDRALPDFGFGNNVTGGSLIDGDYGVGSSHELDFNPTGDHGNRNPDMTSENHYPNKSIWKQHFSSQSGKFQPCEVCVCSRNRKCFCRFLTWALLISVLSVLGTLFVRISLYVVTGTSSYTLGKIPDSPRFGKVDVAMFFLIFAFFSGTFACLRYSLKSWFASLELLIYAKIYAKASNFGPYVADMQAEQSAGAEGEL